MHELMSRPGRMSPIERSSVFEPLARMQSELDRMIADAFGGRGYFGWSNDGDAHLRPAIDLSETEDAIEVTGDLPGLKPEDVEITLTDRILTVKGERKEQKEEKDKDFHRSERYYGSFLRRIALPCEVQGDKVAAKFADGVLKVTLPKAPEAKASGRRIQVTG